MHRTGEQAVFERIAARLAVRFYGLASAETIGRLVADSYERLRATSRVNAHLVVLAERFAAERLTALARAEERRDKPVPEILFVCAGNAGRSQMAAALAAVRGTGRVHARSAGTTPAAELELLIVQAMEESGVGLSSEFPKPLTDEPVAAADLVVSLGCGGACPVLPGIRHLDWTVPDPAGRSPP